MYWSFCDKQIFIYNLLFSSLLTNEFVYINKYQYINNEYSKRRLNAARETRFICTRKNEHVPYEELPYTSDV